MLRWIGSALRWLQDSDRRERETSRRHDRTQGVQYDALRVYDCERRLRVR